VLYDVEKGDVIGKVEKTGKTRSKVTFNQNSPFPGTFPIQRVRVSHWTGEMKTKDGEDWIVKITCLDR